MGHTQTSSIVGKFSVSVSTVYSVPFCAGERERQRERQREREREREREVLLTIKK